MKLTTERIREAFKEYNSQFFNGELTPDFEIGFMKTIRSLGRVTSSRSRHENKVLKFTLSLEFEWNEDTFAKVVLHEMVHVWQMSTGRMKDTFKGGYKQFWKCKDGKFRNYTKAPYERKPWETEAYRMEGHLTELFKNYEEKV